MALAAAIDTEETGGLKVQKASDKVRARQAAELFYDGCRAWECARRGEAVRVGDRIAALLVVAKVLDCPVATAARLARRGLKDRERETGSRSPWSVPSAR
jgi:hypothetical protein